MSLMIVDNLGKAYRTYKSEWHRFGRWLGIQCQPIQEHWVLRHLSFEIQPGEAVGIVGQNGAGKSTLLKMITGTIHPTEGKVEANGRIAAILELGMGFNPELSGRENVFHAAGLMGFSTKQVEDAMPDIEAFAEIGEYFDQPVRTYSSGMQMRVAFAVATAYRPEILIVDEALSVGDSYFQHKSFQRIRDYKERGTALLIVSHDKDAILSVCDKAVLLDEGGMLMMGSPVSVFDCYNALLSKNEIANVQQISVAGGTQTVSGTKEAQILSADLVGESGQVVEVVGVGQEVTIRIVARVNSEIDSIVAGFLIKNRVGLPIYGINSYHLDSGLKRPCLGVVIVYEFSTIVNIGVGSYSVSVALTAGDSHVEKNYEWKDLAIVFEVVNRDNPHFIGVTWMQPNLKVSYE